jgi:hypothetical protein
MATNMNEAHDSEHPEFETPMPLEQLGVVSKSALLSYRGRNRCPVQLGLIIDADTDLDAVLLWLNNIKESKSPQTYRAYRREVERFFLWTLHVHYRAFSDLVVEDFATYRAFLKDPQPSTVWCGPRSPRNSDHWRPFEGPLTVEGRDRALTILRTCITYLVEAGFLLRNPVKLLHKEKQEKSDPHETVEHFLHHNAWSALVDYIDQLPRKTTRDINTAERIRFCFAFYIYWDHGSVKSPDSPCIISIKSAVAGGGASSAKVISWPPSQSTRICWRP